MHYVNNETKDTFKPEYLYLELYPIKERGPEATQKDEDEDDHERGAIVIDIL